MDIILLITSIKTEKKKNGTSKHPEKVENLSTKNGMCLWFPWEKLYSSCGWPRSPSKWSWPLSPFKITMNLFSISNNISRLEKKKKTKLLVKFSEICTIFTMSQTFNLGSPQCRSKEWDLEAPQRVWAVCAPIAADSLPVLWAQQKLGSPVRGALSPS